MNALVNNFVGIVLDLGIFALVALPSLVWLAHERRVDRQLRAAAGVGRPPRPHPFATTTVTVHS
ncbi:hypothetical protein [Streptomyces fuscigenes]|uniref:hypothetical protein n=1 Tax=Streptomyces fuscigenes TaxID=1528880 RepID=UPI001F357A87|nr:hypothetical protein [Streptomyces fuscigenes]MCF3963491.1 hypothetical protein [Streptomyces fuscigenes]